MKREPTPDISLSVAEAREMLGYGLTTMYELIHSGQLKAGRGPGVRGGLGHFRIRLKEVQRFMREREHTVEDHRPVNSQSSHRNSQSSGELR